MKPLNVMAGLGPLNSVLMSLSFLKAAALPLKPEHNFERWVVNRFGRRLYEAFFKSYTEKIWGTQCTEISAEWAAQRIKGLSFRTVVLNAVLGNPKQKIKSLIDEFLYPRLGPGALWERIQQRVIEQGGEVHLNQGVRQVHRDGTRVIGVHRGRQRRRPVRRGRAPHLEHAGHPHRQAARTRRRLRKSSTPPRT